MKISFQKFNIFLNIICYYIIPLVVGGVLFLSQERYSSSIEMGEKAWFLLLVILFMKPLAQILPGLKYIARSLPFRKQLGVAMFWLVIGHGIGTGIHKGLFSIDKFTRMLTQPDHYLFWGILAGMIVFILGITSNIKSMKLLKKNWKRLHMLVYPALVFTALHIYLITGDVTSIMIVGIYGILRIMAYRKIILYPKK